MIIDGRGGSGAVPRAFDVCVVGAGPAGLSIATRLAERGFQVAILEAGGLRPTMRNQRMLVDRPSGSPYWDLQNVRVRMFGGSGSRWGGISRPLDPIDFDERPWVDDSGWPIDRTDIEPYFEQAATLLELPSPALGRGPESTEFEVARYGLSPKLNFGAHYAEQLRDCAGVVVLLNTSVIGLTRSADGTAVRAVETRDFAGQQRTVAARYFVLATGGVENARLLLAADLGNEHDVVGRYFMEHIHAPIAKLVPSGELAGWSSYDTTTWPKLASAFVPRPEVQKAAQLLNASLAVGPTWYIGDPPFVRRDYRVRVAVEWAQRVAPLERIAARMPRWFRGFTTQDVPNGRDDPSQLIVYRGEQPPRRENRVVLGARRDEFGQPMAHLHWTMGEPEAANAERVLELFRASVATNGWGRLSPIAPDWRTRIIGGPHHIGTTRMSADPHLGVVDGDCRVHTVDNLYVAGSSVFPTGGHANPTQTLIALALRVADRLAANCSAG